MSGQSSYRKINYSLRFAKNIERKMISEALKRLVFIESLDLYQYIGFGSIYFSDFKLFHNELNISKMISIESNTMDQERFIFNKPYSFIEMKFGESETILPSLSYDKKSIIWLDYDSQLEISSFQDVNTVVSNISPGSVFLITVNADYIHNKERFESLGNRLGKKRIYGIDGEKINGKKFLEFSWGLINNEINDTLSQRNLNEENKIHYKQLFNFSYSDGARMLTTGGIFYDKSINAMIPKCNFSNIEFIRSQSETYNINIPNLTFREITHLNTLMPITEENIMKAIVPKKEAEQYNGFYRYYPFFTEASF